MVAVLTSGCTSLGARLDKAAEVKGAAEAHVELPALPDDCRVQEPHAGLTAGDEVRSVLKRERAQLDKANARVGRCADHYDGLLVSLK